MKKTYFVLILLCALVTAGACQQLEKPKTSNPEITTLTPQIYSDHVILQASANEDVDFTASTSTYFEISTTSGYSSSQKFDVAGQITQAYVATLELYGLEPSTKYYSRFCAECGDVVIRGNTVSFTTMDAQPTAALKSVTCTEKKYYPSGIKFNGNTYNYTFKFEITAYFTSISQIKEGGIIFNSTKSIETLSSNELTETWTHYTTSKTCSVNIKAYATTKSGTTVYSDSFSKSYTYGSSKSSNVSEVEDDAVMSADVPGPAF